MVQSALHFSHELLEKRVQSGDSVVDATVGNGHDTLFLAHLVGKTGHVYGFDIQEQAIQATQKHLDEHGQASQVHLFQQGHEMVAQVLPNETSIQAAIFNLGYLPSGDKTIVTQAQTTLKSVEQLLPMLDKKGLIILVLYSGHEEGMKEKKAILKKVTELPQEKYNVLSYQFMNQKNNPPSLVVIEKK